MSRIMGEKSRDVGAGARKGDGGRGRRVLIGLAAALAVMVAAPVAAQAADGLSNQNTNNTSINGQTLNWGRVGQNALPATQTIYLWSNSASGGFLNLSTRTISVNVNLSNTRYVRSGGSCSGTTGSSSFSASYSYQGGSSFRSCTIILSLTAGTPTGVQNGTLSYSGNASGSANVTATVTPQNGAVLNLAGPGGATGSYDFGQVAIGDSATRTFTVSNPGTVDVANLNATLGGSSSNFSITGGTCGSSLPILSSPCTVDVTFQPTAELGSESTTLNVNSTTHGTQSINLTASGLQPSNDLSVSPTDWDFGTAAVGYPVGKAFTVTNTGNTTLTLDFAHDSGADVFPRTGGTCEATLGVGSSCTYVVEWSPESGGAAVRNGGFTVTGSNALAPADAVESVTLTGERVAPEASILIQDTAGAAPKPTHDFGGVNVGASTAYTFTVRNTGNVPVPVGSVSLAGPEAASFSVTGNTCTGTIARGATCQVTVNASPSRTGLKQATLTVAPAAAAVQAAPQSVALSASGTGIRVLNDVNDNLSNISSKRWLESVAVGGAAPTGDVIRAMFEVDLGNAQTIEDVLFSSSTTDNDTSPADNTFNPLPPNQFQVNRKPGSSRAVITAATPSASSIGTDIGKYNFSDGLGGLCVDFITAVRSKDDARRVWFKFRDSSGNLSAAFGTRMRFTDARFACGGVPIIYDQQIKAIGGAAQPANTQNAVVDKGTPITVGFKGDTEDDNQFTGVNWRIRNTRTGDMFVQRPSGYVACAEPCTDDGNFGTGGSGRVDFGSGDTGVEREITIPGLPSRGRWVVEAAGRGQNQDLSYFMTLATVWVNGQGASPTVSLSGAPPARPETDSTYTITANVADPADSSTSGFDPQGGRPEVIEWDLNNNPNDGPSGDGFELRFEGDSASGVPSQYLTRSFSTVGLPPGPYTIRARVTDNGGVNQADPSSRTAVATSNFTINSPPVATSEFVDIEADQEQPADITFRATDADGDPYTVNLLPSTTTGSITGAGNTKQYTWPSTFTGNDEFHFTATDDKNGTGPEGVLTVRVRPNTTIDYAAPAGSNPVPEEGFLGATTETDAEFAFSSPQSPVVAYECRLLLDGQVVEGEDWANCASASSGGKAYEDLDDGLYRFEVRAINDEDQRDGTPTFAEWRVDNTAPVVRLVTGPASDMPNADPRPTNDSTPSYSFDVDDRSPQEHVTYECRIMSGPEAGDWKPCGAPSSAAGSAPVDLAGPGTAFGYESPLEEGVYTLEVRATDDVGLLGPVHTENFRVDLTPPATSIASGPDGLINTRDVTFQVTSTEANSTFACRLVGESQGVLFEDQLCPGGATPTFTGLADDVYTLEFTAIDPATNRDPNPPVAEFEIDATEPETTGGDVDFGDGVTSVRRTQSRRITVSFDGTDSRQMQGFQCRIDSTDEEGWQTCQSPETYGGLADGEHRLEIRSRDEATNVDSSPIVIDWVIDRTQPNTTIDLGPDAVTNETAPEIQFSIDEDGTSECSLDGGSWQPCASPVSAETLNGGQPLPDGPHTISVRSTDIALNAEDTPATYSWSQDTTVPVVELNGAPAALTPVVAADFGWTVEDGDPLAPSPDALSECQLDGGDWEPCGRSFTVEEPSSGVHTFSVRATDEAGNVSDVVTHEWEVLGEPLDAPTIDNSDPVDGATTRVANAAFAFSHARQEDPVFDSFECKVDEEAWSDCESPYEVYSLGDGDHEFQVRARDVVGNLSDPATVSWSVQSAAPVTTIQSGPNGLTRERGASIGFDASSPSTFECKLDGGAWEACSSPVELADLPDGEHSFSVRAVSSVAPVGVKDPTPPSRTWTVDATAPQTALATKPPASGTSRTADFTFSSPDETAGFQCKLDEQDYVSCASPYRLTDVAIGAHVLLVRAVDEAGNVDDTPEQADWTVNAPPVEPPPPGDPGENGNFVASLTEGELSVPSLGPVPLPAGQLVLTGSRGEDGTWTVPQSGVDFKPVEQLVEVPNIGNVTVKISIQATGPGAGRLPNGGGAASFSLPVQAKVEASLGSLVVIGPAADCYLRPVQFTLSGTYDEAARTATVGSTNVSFPTVSAGCGPLGAQVNGALELPRSDVAISLTFGLRDIVAPETTIDSKPDAVTSSRTADFTFSSSEAGATFECRRDGGAWVPCGSPVQLTELSDGGHAFDVRAVGATGLKDETPASHTWTVAGRGTVRIKSLMTKVKKNAFRVRLACSTADCAGRVLASVKSKKKKSVTVGKAAYSLTAGATKVVKVKLNGKGRKRLKAAGRKGLKVTVAAVPRGAKAPEQRKRATLRSGGRR